MDGFAPINYAAVSSATAVLNVASGYAFGCVLTSLPGFVPVTQMLIGIADSFGPLLSAVITTNIMAGITGSASGGLTIALSMLGDQWAAMAQAAGIPLEVLHPHPRPRPLLSASIRFPLRRACKRTARHLGLTHHDSYYDIAVVMGLSSQSRSSVSCSIWRQAWPDLPFPLKTRNVPACLFLTDASLLSGHIHVRIKIQVLIVYLIVLCKEAVSCMYAATLCCCWQHSSGARRSWRRWWAWMAWGRFRTQRRATRSASCSWPACGLYGAARGRQPGARARIIRLESRLETGCIMFLATSFQQVAMLYTTAGKTAFITALYIIFVPIGAAFLGSRIRIENWIGAVLALVGLYYLSIHGSMDLSFGDMLVFISALFWTAHILFIDRFACLVDPIELSTTQIGVCTLGSVICALCFETATPMAFADAWFAIFYGGVMSAGVAFTLQIVGQKYAEPSQAAIIMSFEAVFGAVSSWLLLNETMAHCRSSAVC